MDIQPVTLVGAHVRLEPLTEAHAAALWEAGRDPEIFRWFLTPPFAQLGDVERWVEDALRHQQGGKRYSKYQA